MIAPLIFADMEPEQNVTARNEPFSRAAVAESPAGLQANKYPDKIKLLYTQKNYRYDT